jgi:hypothetical protein
MNGVDDLVTWLRAQLDEDERVAREADSGRWLPEDKGITFEYRADDFHGGEAQARLVADTRANQWHIANWDPARVLAEVEAKRRILDLHHVTEFESEPDHDPMGAGCAECGHFDWPCETIRLLALPYAGRDGWREEWRVSP